MAILSSYPRVVDPFKQGTHSGLNFVYEIGIVRKDNVVIKVDAGILALADDSTNYIEASDIGVVSANQVGYTSGALPLYTVIVAAGKITTVIDDRCFFNLANTGGGGYLTGFNISNLTDNEYFVVSNYVI